MNCIMAKMSDEQIISFVLPYTLVSRERLQNVLDCIEHISPQQHSR